MKSLAAAVKSTWDGEIVPENCPKFVSQSNGEIERAVSEVHGMARTLKDFVEQKANVELKGEMPILSWIIQYGATLYRLLHKGYPHDGQTAYQRLRGRPWRVPLPPFGECVDFRRRTTSKIAPRWERGISLGVKGSTTEKIVPSDTTIYVVQSIRRCAPDARWDAARLTGLKGTPWEPNPAAGESIELPAPVDLPMRNPDVPRRLPRPQTLPDNTVSTSGLFWHS